MQGVLIKQVFIFLTILILHMTTLYGEFQPWAEKLLEITHRMDDENLTQKELEKIADEENKYYNEILHNILLRKNDFLNQPKKYDTEIFNLERILRVNKRNHNKYAVLRDEVLIKSYKLIRIQNNMVRKIFEALDYYDIDAFEIKMNDLFAESQIDIHALDDGRL